MKTIKEIEARMAAIAKELEDDENADVEKLTKEVEELEAEKKSLVEAAEKRSALLEKAKNSVNFVEGDGEEEKRKVDAEQAEYRMAFLKRLQGKDLTESEKRAYALSGVNGALPVATAEEVIKKLSQYAPMLEEITLLRVPGQVKFAVEGTKTAGAVHTENASITGDSDTVVTVSLGGYEVTKLIQISKSVEKMTVDSFEKWLVDMIAEMIGAKIEDLIFNGTGSNQPTGIDHITWGAGNSVTVAANADITAANIRTLVGLLPGGYDSGAKMYMRKNTLFARIMSLQDNAKHDLVKTDGKDYFIYGYPVKLSDKAPANEIILGNAKKYVGNLSEDITVVSDFDINTNSNKYLGCAIFDGKPAVEEAFVKLVQATS